MAFLLRSLSVSFLFVTLPALAFYQFNQVSYPDNHWAVVKKKRSDPEVVALFEYKGNEYTLYLNPSDSRGARSIVRLMAEDNRDTFNREYTAEEENGLLQVMGLVSRAYRKLDLWPQMSLAGNKSHQFDPNTDAFTVGNMNEPSMLHGHIIGRGDPNKLIAPGFQLGGPVPGIEFNMFGNDKSIPPIQGNNRKVPWTPEAQIFLRDILAKAINEVLKPDIEFNAIRCVYYGSEIEAKI